MSDIVERLLDQDSDWIYTERAEAAVEITRLRAELAEARAKAFEEAAKALDSRASIYEEKKAKADPFAPDDCNRHERMVHTMEAMEIAAQAIRAMIEKDTTP